MVPAWAYPLSFFLFVGLPISILVAGIILYFTRSKHRKAIGALLTLAGGLQLSFWLLFIRDLAFVGLGIYVATMFSGIACLYFSKNRM